MMYILVCFFIMVKGHDTTVNGEKWCYTNGNGQCKINGKTHPCPTCGNNAQNGCFPYPSTTSPDGMSKKKGYDIQCPDAAPKAGNTCIKEKCFGYTFECKDGYVVETTGKKEYSLTCSNKKYQWQKCVEAKCTPGDAPNATPASTKEISVGQKVEYKCNPGFARNETGGTHTATCASDGNGGYALDGDTGCPERLGCMDSSAINFVPDATMNDPANPCHECENSADCGENASCESNKCKCKSGYAGKPGKDGHCFISCGDEKCVKGESCIDSTGKVFCACGTSSDDCITAPLALVSPGGSKCDGLGRSACVYKTGCSWNAEEGKCEESGTIGAYKLDDEEDTTNWGLIFGIIFSLLFLLLCCIFLLCMWWRKRERKDQGLAEDRIHGLPKDLRQNVDSSACSVSSARSHHKSRNKGGSSRQGSGSKNKMDSGRTHRSRGIE
eukprot:GEMP01023923.1.p1 GENE.GEMP01023923.1~~GEMP01023923.1.p1  ORF type:complete len:441 (+),score=50.50 GEMP01023923.1:173-1495(+)